MANDPVEVLVGGRPIRASSRSALWYLEAAEQLWMTRGRMDFPTNGERPDKSVSSS